MIPNQLVQATEELKRFKLEPNAIPKEIHKNEGEGYVFIGIKSRDTADRTAKVHTAKTLYAPIIKHEEMQREVSAGRSRGGLFNGQFTAVIVLHNPLKPKTRAKKKVETTKKD